MKAYLLMMDCYDCCVLTSVVAVSTDREKMDKQAEKLNEDVETSYGEATRNYYVEEHKLRQ